MRKRPILFDGGMGTMLQRLGLKPGGCPDELNLTEPGMIKKVHRAYREAGSDVVTTNTFGANRIKLKEYNLEGRLREINVAAARLAREAAGEEGFVAGDMGPTGAFIEPVGEIGFDEAVEVFSEQARALKDGGADLFIIETMMDIKEVKAAIIAAREAGLPVAATMTFDETMRTVLGTTPESFALMAQPNAGIPVLKGGETVFPATPEEMAAYVPRLVEAGVRVLGGCCGTTPEHIKRFAGVFRATRPVARKPLLFTGLSSRTSFVIFGGGLPPVIIGERINPTGRKKFADEIKEGKITRLRTEAREQAEAGAHALDVNVGVPGIDEAVAMRRAIFTVNENSSLPVVIDSSSPAAIEAGLKAVDGKPLINSISGEEKKLREILPLARKYGGALLALTLDDTGIPATAEGRLKVAEKILKRALKAGVRKEDLIFDCLAMTVSADPKGALATLEAIRLIKEELGLATVLGVSNISFGLPARDVINAGFLTMALSAGLDCAIINPKNTEMMDAYHASLVLTGKDLRAERFIKRFHVESAVKEAPAAEERKVPEGIRERLRKAIIEGDEENVTALVEAALKEGLDPLEVSNEGLVPGLEEVGRLFACNRYFLPQVMLSADTMKRAFERLKKEIKGRGGPKLGKVLLATVEGDIHDIGKNIVATLLENHGFEVIDLGKNVPTERIIEEAVKNKVDIVGLSALMTTTVMEMDNVIKKLKERGIKALTIVGGAVVTEEFSKKIGADQYGGDAISAVEKMKRMVREGKG